MDITDVALNNPTAKLAQCDLHRTSVLAVYRSNLLDGPLKQGGVIPEPLFD